MGSQTLAVLGGDIFMLMALGSLLPSLALSPHLQMLRG